MEKVSLIQIAHSWFNFLKGTPETQQMMAHRLKICDTCTSKLQIDNVGQRILGFINKETSTYRCGECRCPLAGKTAHPDNTCPLNKWGKWITPETYY